ncbi:unnamed protein product [Effrenium voratum]|uniref:Uncharacterized protein n=1 Tax=Effrenium voratum TaxID=2562239 RepID=A0AA36JNJ7_9DINO|nr:unnamed protein product [Effrenium voratum]
MDIAALRARTTTPMDRRVKREGYFHEGCSCGDGRFHEHLHQGCSRGRSMGQDRGESAYNRSLHDSAVAVGSEIPWAEIAAALAAGTSMKDSAVAMGVSVKAAEEIFWDELEARELGL